MQTTPRQAVTRQGPVGAVRWNWRLHIVCSGDAHKVGQVLHLGVEHHGWLLGRAHDGDAAGLRLHDVMMSREHLRLTVRGPDATTVTVEDLASTNGTFCNGVRITCAEAGTGAVLRFGDTVAVLEADLGRALAFDTPCANVPGHSEVARLARAAMQAAAEGPLPALIVGQTGTGKEYAAAELHRLSARRGPLVRVNIAAPPDSLFESELFGAAAGAYTGAQKARRGRIAEAHGGTLVLDEIGELPMAQQAKLLRVLEEGVLRPLGATADQPFDVRFVASTNADLDERVRDGLFRGDLLARLRGALVVLAPLHERRADLLDLADAISPLTDSARGAPWSWRSALPAEHVEALLLRPWPYNLRDLRSVLLELQRLLGDPAALGHWLLAEAARASPSTDATGLRASATSTQRAPPDLAARFVAEGTATPRIGDGAAPSQAPREWPPRRRRAPKPDEMRALLQRCEGNVEAMARELGCARRQVYRWLEAAEIDQADLDAVREEVR